MPRKESTASTLQPPVPAPTDRRGGEKFSDSKKPKKKFARHKIRSDSPTDLIMDIEMDPETQVNVDINQHNTAQHCKITKLCNT